MRQPHSKDSNHAELLPPLHTIARWTTVLDIDSRRGGLTGLRVETRKSAEPDITRILEFVMLPN